MINTNYLLDLFKTVESGKVQLFNLKPGQMVHGQIMELIDSKQALVSIKGNNILARLEVPLSKGQQSWFLVQSVGEEVKLKMVNDKGTGNKPISTPQELIKHLNLKNNSNNQQIILSMIKNNLPIEKSTIEHIANVLHSNEDIENSVFAVKLLSEKNIPITSENIKSILEFFKEDGILNKLNILNQRLDTIDMKGLPHEIKAQLQRVQNQITELTNGFKMEGNVEQNDELNPSTKPILQNQQPTITSNSNSENTVRRQPEMLLNQLTDVKPNQNQPTNTLNNEDLDNDIHQTLSKELSNQGKNNLQHVDVRKPDSNKIMNQIVKFLEQLQLKGSDGFSTEPGANLKENLEDLYIKKDLLPKDLGPALEKAIHHLAGQHILTSNHNQAVFNQTVIQFPNFTPFSESPVFVQVHTRKKDNKNIDQNNIRFVFLFYLLNLGDTMVDMRVLEKQIFVQLYNNNPLIKEVIKRLEGNFINFVKNEGFQTTGISIQPMKEKELKDVVSSTPSYTGVDIKV